MILEIWRTRSWKLLVKLSIFYVQQCYRTEIYLWHLMVRWRSTTGDHGRMEVWSRRAILRRRWTSIRILQRVAVLGNTHSGVLTRLPCLRLLRWEEWRILRSNIKGL